MTCSTPAQVGMNITKIDLPIVHVNNIQEQFQLSDVLEEKDKYYILNLGSCSCPPFVLSLKQIANSKSKDNTKFIHIYVDEAHPRDGWYIGDEQAPPKHKNLKDREMASLEMTKIVDINNVYLDSISNKIKNFFGVKPGRLYVIKNGVIIYQGGQGPFRYSLEDMYMSIFKIV